MQGYELTDEEVHISLEDFKARFKGGDGLPEYVEVLQLPQTVLTVSQVEI
jgi:hypothetical protein